MTGYDFQPGPDGLTKTTDDVFLCPIAGAKIILLGMENHAAASSP